VPVHHRASETLWSNGPIFVLAVTGAAAGLGNVWKFPYLVGANGGGAFLALYLVCLAVLGVPLLSAEIMIGRRGRGNPVHAIATVASLEGRWPSWQLLGWIGLLACCLLLSTYSVVGGWAMAYVFRAASGMFGDLDVLQAAEVFHGLIRDPERLLAWHTLFLAVTVMIVSRGVRWGLEEAVRWFMPMLLGLLLLLTGYTAAASGHFEQALAIMFRPDLDAFSWRAIPLALGHAFYTLTIGFGVVLTYASYLDEETPILRASVLIVLMDTVVAILAGLVVFPVIFGTELSSTSGPALIFQTLPLAFGQMPNGTWFGTLFFLLLAFAAWTSAIALLEPPVAYLVQRWGMNRAHATSYVGVFVWLLGVVALLSFSVWGHVRPLRALELFRGSTLFDLFNFVAANMLLPLGGLLMAIFVGWRLTMRSAELELGGGRGFAIWRFLIRYVTPLAMLVVLADAAGLVRETFF
jgi:NSS family neurotransmitter:Na+ symporter